MTPQMPHMGEFSCCRGALRARTTTHRARGRRSAHRSARQKRRRTQERKRMPGEGARADTVGDERAVGVGTERVEDFCRRDRRSVNGAGRRPLAAVPRGTRELQVARRHVDRQRVLCGLKDRRRCERCVPGSDCTRWRAMAARRRHHGPDARQRGENGDTHRDHRAERA